MKRKKVLISLQVLGIWLITILPTACVDEIELNSVSFEKLLVVDGNISDQSIAHEVFLSYTSPIDDNSDESEPVTGAAVWIEDNEGNRTNFIEHDTGSYLSPINFAGTTGRSYALFITTAEGKEYQSSFQELVAAPEIDSIYNRFAVKEFNQTAETLPGAQFFIDVKNTEASTQFYRYEWTDTHQIIVPYIKGLDATRQPNGNYVITPFDENVRECYRERGYNELILATSTNNASAQLSEVPIKFSSSRDFDVTTSYSIEVTQRAISAAAYSYYRRIELFNESNGSLFDKQQGIIIGNMISIDNPDEKVLGYFEVSGISKKRVFFELEDLDNGVIENAFKPCFSLSQIEYDGGTLRDFYEATDIPEGNERATAITVRAQYELYDAFPGLTGTTWVLAHRFCVDCTYRGQLGKPDYWP